MIKQAWVAGPIGWFVMFCAVVVGTILHPSHGVTGVYSLASQNFLQGKQIYPDIGVDGPLMGFLYPPGFAVLYLPFEWLGSPVGTVLWKAIGLWLLTYAAWSTCKALADHYVGMRAFSIALFISIPLVAGSFSNGQDNIHMIAACWLMTLSAFRNQSYRVIIWTGFAILKPLAVVMILLIAGLKPKMIPALIAGVVWAIALPLLAADWHYVFSLYRHYLAMLQTMGSNFDAADFTAMFSALNLQFGPAVILAIRCVSAFATWAVAFWLSSRLPQEPAALAVVVLGSLYMCLFNSRAEGLSYSMLALPIAIVIGMGLQKSPRKALWYASAFVLFATGTNAIFKEVFEQTRLWFKPSMTILTLVLMAAALRRDHLNAGSAGDQPRISEPIS